MTDSRKALEMDKLIGGAAVLHVKSDTCTEDAPREALASDELIEEIHIERDPDGKGLTHRITGQRKKYRVSPGDEAPLSESEEGGHTTDPGCINYVAQRAVQKAHRAVDRVEEFVYAVWEVVGHHSLPEWLQDNDFLKNGHRPQLNSYWACFKSIFRVHTETGNIWTHLLGFMAFIAISIYVTTRSHLEVQLQEKIIFNAFFLAAITCLGFSFLFHTLFCHSETVGRLFGKLDYCGISVMVMGSFIPWLYYCFYCRVLEKTIYLVLVVALGVSCIIVSLWEKFASPKFRPVRAGLFIGFGLSGVVPAMHYIITDGLSKAISIAGMGWLLLMAALYIVGAVIYAMRIPERIWPGKFDIWLQSHQIFHVFVVAAAFVHYHGITIVSTNMLKYGDCSTMPMASDWSIYLQRLMTPPQSQIL